MESCLQVKGILIREGKLDLSIYLSVYVSYLYNQKVCLIKELYLYANNKVNDITMIH